MDFNNIKPVMPLPLPQMSYNPQIYANQNQYQPHMNMLIPQATEEVSSFMEPPQENQQTRENSTCNFLYDLDQIMDDIRSTLHPLQYEMYRKILKKYIQSKIPKTVLDFELNRLLGTRFPFIHNAHNQDYDPNSTYELMSFTNKKQYEKEFLGQAEEQIILESGENSLENSESNNNSNIKIDNQKLVDNSCASGKIKGNYKRVIPPPLQLKDISAVSMQSPMSPVNEQSQSGTQQKKNKISKFAPQIQDFKNFDQAPGVSKHPEDVKRANKNYQHNNQVPSQTVKTEEQQNSNQTPTTIRLPQHKKSQDSLQTMQMQLNLSNKVAKTIEKKLVDAESSRVYKKDDLEVCSDEKDSESSLLMQEQQHQQNKRIKLAHQGSYHQIFDIQKVKNSLNQTPINNAPIFDNTISIQQESFRESPTKINIKQIQKQSPIQQQVVSTNQEQISDKIQTQVLPCTEKIQSQNQLNNLYRFLKLLNNLYLLKRIIQFLNNIFLIYNSSTQFQQIDRILIYCKFVNLSLKLYKQKLLKIINALIFICLSIKMQNFKQAIKQQIQPCFTMKKYDNLIYFKYFNYQNSLSL